jgi:sporulation protein YlmC with PRC-barrel domain
MANLRRLAGKHVVGPDGERIGKVADVYESTAADGGTFATVTTGLLGTGSSFFPLDAAELVDGDVQVPYTKEFIRQAPRVANDDELTAEEEDRLFAYYGLAADAPGEAAPALRRWTLWPRRRPTRATRARRLSRCRRSGCASAPSGSSPAAHGSASTSCPRP